MNKMDGSSYWLLGSAATTGVTTAAFKWGSSLCGKEIFSVLTSNYAYYPTIGGAAALFVVARIVDNVASHFLGEFLGTALAIVVESAIYSALPLVLTVSPLAPVVVAIVLVAFKILDLNREKALLVADIEKLKMEISTDYTPNTVVNNLYIKKDEVDKDYTPNTVVNNQYIKKDEVVTLHPRNDLEEDSSESEVVKKKETEIEGLKKKNYDLEEKLRNVFNELKEGVEKVKKQYSLEHEQNLELEKQIKDNVKIINEKEEIIKELEEKHDRIVKVNNNLLERDKSLVESLNKHSLLLNKMRSTLGVVKGLLDKYKDRENKEGLFKELYDVFYGEGESSSEEEKKDEVDKDHTHNALVNNKYEVITIYPRNDLEGVSIVSESEVIKQKEKEIEVLEEENHCLKSLVEKCNIEFKKIREEIDNINQEYRKGIVEREDQSNRILDLLKVIDNYEKIIENSRKKEENTKIVVENLEKQIDLVIKISDSKLEQSSFDKMEIILDNIRLVALVNFTQVFLEKHRGCEDKKELIEGLYKLFSPGVVEDILVKYKDCEEKEELIKELCKLFPEKSESSFEEKK